MGTGGVTEFVSCGVQVAGENVNREEGVDTDEKSVEVSYDSSESAMGEVLVGNRWRSLMSCSVSLSSWLWVRSVSHGSEVCN